MKNKVLETIRRHGMLTPGETVYVAVSGGQDSVCLLDFMMQIKDEFRLTLGIIHVNHLLRADESDKDAAFVENLARKYHIPYHVKAVDVRALAQEQKLSLEDAARKCRYQAFISFAKEKHIRKFAVAHTKDDQAETVLMRILRGTGLKGFRSIHPTVSFDAVTFIRPFIEIFRSEVEHYAASHKIRYRIDLTNKSIRYFRNKVRHELLPLLAEEYNPQIKMSLARMSETVYQDYQYLIEKADEEYKRVLKKEKEDVIILDKEVFAGLHVAMQYRVLLKAVTAMYPRFVFEFSQWERYKEALDMKRKYSVPIGQGLIPEIAGRELFVKRQKQITPYEYHVHGDQEVLVKEAEISLTFTAVDEPTVSKSRAQGKEVIDLEKIAFPLIVRNRTQGDRMRPLGMRFEKKLKDILIDKKMPHYLRDEVPLVVSKGKIVWCWGVGIADPFRISPQTKRGLEIGAELVDKTVKRD